MKKPLKMLTYVLLLTECVGFNIATANETKLEPAQSTVSEQSNDPFRSGALHTIWLASKHMIGDYSYCLIGGQGGAATYHLGGLSNSLYQAMRNKPWLVADNSDEWEFRGRLNRIQGLDFAKEIDGRIEDWSMNRYQYAWSLIGAKNRQIFEGQKRLTKQAIQELFTYYKDALKASDEDAQRWARFYVYSIRYLGSWLRNESFKRIFDQESYDRFQSGRASIRDFKALAGAMPHGKDEVYPQALLLAVGAKANVHYLQKLIETGADINNANEDTPLMNAVDHLPSLDFLIKAGADVDASNGFGKTALMMAAHMNRPESVQALIKAGANPNIKTLKVIPKVMDLYGERMIEDCRYEKLKIRERTALMYAMENASLSVIKMLVDAGADISAVDSRRRSLSQYLSMNEVISMEEAIEVRKLLATP